MRVVNNDGRDELYTGVIKFIIAGGNYLIYTEISTFTIPVYEVGFVQVWDSEKE